MKRNWVASRKTILSPWIDLKLDRFWYTCTQKNPRKLFLTLTLGRAEPYLTAKLKWCLGLEAVSYPIMVSLSLYSYHIKIPLKHTSARSCRQPLSLAISNVHSSHPASEGTEELQINYNKSRQETEKGFTVHIIGFKIPYIAHWGTQLQEPQKPPGELYQFRYAQPTWALPAKSITVTTHSQG